jgi:S-adenosylmethionine decarboxylase
LNTQGRHLLAEYSGCDADVLNDLERVETLMKRAAEASGTTIVATVFHPFTPQGVSGVVVVEESHLSIHTWPEHGYAAVDFFTCGEGDPELAHAVLREGLMAQQAEIMMVDRGKASGRSALSLRYHRTEATSGSGAAQVPRLSASAPVAVRREVDDQARERPRRLVVRAYQ